MNTIEKLHQLFLKHPVVSTDTRNIQKNCIFICLKGTNFDANTFAKEALNKGAAAAIIDNSDYYIDHRTPLVNDSLKTLQELAQFHRKFLNIPIIALTGSNGKTTTKELLHTVLSKKFNTGATKGNYNNHIGVPLTLLSFDTNTEMGIVEMGANHQKEIEFLCKLAQPDYGYITNFGKAHLEGFGGIQGIIKGKSELYDHLQKNNKFSFLNFDDPIQHARSKSLKHYSFSIKTADADIRFTPTDNVNFAKTKIANLTIKSKLIGDYNVTNINAAITIGKYFKISNSLIKDAIEDYTPTNNRSQLIQLNNNQIILDCYNANPSSMEVAINNFLTNDHNSKWLILGDMFELGEESDQEHQKIIQLLIQSENHKTTFIGEAFFRNKTQNKKLCFYKSFDDFSSELSTRTIQNKHILIKGSRGMALERTLDQI